MANVTLCHYSFVACGSPFLEIFFLGFVGGLIILLIKIQTVQQNFGILYISKFFTISCLIHTKFTEHSSNIAYFSLQYKAKLLYTDKREIPSQFIIKLWQSEATKVKLWCFRYLCIIGVCFLILIFLNNYDLVLYKSRVCVCVCGEGL